MAMPSRAEILDAAQTGKARAFVRAIDDVEASLRTAELVRQLYPSLPVFARARNRNHSHRLLDLGVTAIQRETFPSALETTRQVLARLGSSRARDRPRYPETFQAHDERRLNEDYAQYSDMEKMQAKARSDAATLERLFEEDAAEVAKADAAAAKNPKQEGRIDGPGINLIGGLERGFSGQRGDSGRAPRG